MRSVSYLSLVKLGLGSLASLTDYVRGTLDSKMFASSSEQPGSSMSISPMGFMAELLYLMIALLPASVVVVC